MDITMSVAVQVQGYVDIGFFRSAAYFGLTLAGKKEFGNFVPIFGNKGADVLKSFTSRTSAFGDRFQRRSVFLQKDGTAAQILCQFHICGAVADDEAIGKVVLRIIQVFGKHTGTGFAGRSIIGRHAAVYADVVERDPLSFQRLHHKIVCGPEGFFREGCCTQPVLVGHHHKLKIQLAADKAEIAHYFRIELQLFQ